jgi:transcriptional regulator with XRE-family HTH domain
MAKNSLKEVLDRGGLSRGALSGLSGVSSSTISRILAKKKRPSPSTMKRLLRAINRLERERAYSIQEVFPDFRGGVSDPPLKNPSAVVADPPMKNPPPPKPRPRPTPEKKVQN